MVETRLSSSSFHTKTIVYKFWQAATSFTWVCLLPSSHLDLFSQPVSHVGKQRLLILLQAPHLLILFSHFQRHDVEWANQIENAQLFDASLPFALPGSQIKKTTFWPIGECVCEREEEKKGWKRASLFELTR